MGKIMIVLVFVLTFSFGEKLKLIKTTDVHCTNYVSTPDNGITVVKTADYTYVLKGFFSVPVGPVNIYLKNNRRCLKILNSCHIIID